MAVLDISDISTNQKLISGAPFQQGRHVSCPPWEQYDYPSTYLGLRWRLPAPDIPLGPAGRLEVHDVPLRDGQPRGLREPHEPAQQTGQPGGAGVQVPRLHPEDSPGGVGSCHHQRGQDKADVAADHQFDCDVRNATSW